jgi:hypothetical protein
MKEHRMTEESYRELKTKFEKTFSEPCDDEKLMKLIQVFSFEKIKETVEYLYVVGLEPIKEGVHRNIYGLIFRLTNKNK